MCQLDIDKLEVCVINDISIIHLMGLISCLVLLACKYSPTFE